MYLTNGLVVLVQTMVTDNIILGGRDEAENVSLLLEHGVTHILNTAQQLPNYFPQTFVYLKLPLLGENTTVLYARSRSHPW